jgi:hypothetical protein
VNRHGIKTTTKEVFFFSFKGDSTVSSLDQITLPPAMGLSDQMFHRFGEWLKREGHAWEYLSEERLCQLSIEFFNLALMQHEKPRRFDRMATKEEIKVGC